MRAVEARLAERLESPVGAIPRGGRAPAGRGRQAAAPAARRCWRRAPPARRSSTRVAVGCAAELIHTATLYHDDVVDDGRVRRGRPAARMVFGNGLVVLVGDFCLARALETVALTGSLPMVRSLAATVTEMAEGEVAQLERAGNPDATVEEYFRVIDRKTASLIAWCARVGGSVGDDARRAARALRPRARARVPDRRRRARQRDRRGDRRQVGRPRSAGGQADAAGAAGLRGRSGARPARARAPRRDAACPAAVVAEILTEVRAAGRRRARAPEGGRAGRRGGGRAGRAAGLAATATGCVALAHASADRSSLMTRCAATARRGAAAAGSTDAVPAHWDDLASFVRYLEQRGELRRITRRSIRCWRSRRSRSRRCAPTARRCCSSA